MGSFAFGREGREQVIRNIANLRTFEHGGVSGRQGGTRRLNKLPRAYARGLDDAVYVVYCYDTPIAWVTMEDDATEEGRVNFMPDWQYSATTTYYQSLVWAAWGDKVVDPDPRFSARENRGTARGRSSDVRYGRVPAPVRGPSAEQIAREARRTAQLDAERRSSVPSRTAPSGPPEYLLDRRYSDPDWSPGLPDGADQRDERRVERDLERTGGTRRAHP
jgi:hypothetical protein